jgi:hypothetical protein
MLHACVQRFDVTEMLKNFAKFLATKHGLCLVREKKIFGCHIGCFMGCRKGFSDTNKKTNYIAPLETARRIY